MNVCVVTDSDLKTFKLMCNFILIGLAEGLCCVGCYVQVILKKDMLDDIYPQTQFTVKHGHIHMSFACTYIVGRNVS